MYWNFLLQVEGKGKVVPVL